MAYGDTLELGDFSGTCKEECRAPRNQENIGRENSRRTVTVETPTEDALVSQDRIGGATHSRRSTRKKELLTVEGKYVRGLPSKILKITILVECLPERSNLKALLIKEEFSVARTPQQNGVTERRNRTLIEATRTMSKDRKDYDGNLFEQFSPFKNAFALPHVPNVFSIDDTGIFGNAYDDEYVGVEADLNNLETTMNVSSIPTTRIDKDHPKDQIIRDLNSAIQTRRMTKISDEHAMVSYINKQKRTNHKDYQNCLFACLIFQKEPKKVIQALEDPSWIEAMQEELLQFELQKVWILVDLPNGKRAIRTKWVFRNKKDERGIVVRNNARLVAQGYTQEEGIDYDEVFAPVARIEAIRLFFAYASNMGFIVYQMDIKSAFLYGTIEEEILEGQPEIAAFGFPRAFIIPFPDSDFWCLPRQEEESTTEGCSILGEDLISWQCMKQTIVANSTTEAEYVAATNCCGQYCGRNLTVFHSKTKGTLRIKDSSQMDSLLDEVEIQNASYVQYSVIWSIPTICTYYTSCIEQFWATAKVKTVNGERQLQALVDKKKVIITETSIRSDLNLEDAGGTDCLPTATIFEELARMGYEKPSPKLTFYKAFFSPQWKFLIHTITQCLSAKTTAWNEFSSTMASAIICLATNQKFNLSKYIFDAMPTTEENTPEENVATPSCDPPQSSEDRMKLIELMNLCTQLQSRVLALETTKSNQALEIESLKRRVKSLEKRRKSRTPGFKRLRKVGSASRVESSNDVSLGAQEDASKQGRKIADLDADAEVTMEKDVAKKEVSVANPVTIADEVVTTANVEVTTVNDPTTTIDELTLAQTLIEIKVAKPKAVTSAATTTTTIRPKARGVVVQEPTKGITFRDAGETTTRTPTSVSSSSIKDKGKAKMVEPEVPLNKKDQIRLDEELARRLDAEEQEAARLERENVELQEQATLAKK
ncbi:putative ribonuclease H-like domain-containing protein [Tanacetum coccineum]